MTAASAPVLSSLVLIYDLDLTWTITSWARTEEPGFLAHLVKPINSEQLGSAA